MLENLQEKLDKPLITSKFLLARARFLDPNTKYTATFNDPSYFPFYYYLGGGLKSEQVLEVGFDLGLTSSCFLQGCKTVKSYDAFREKDVNYYSHRLGRANILEYLDGEFRFFDDFKLQKNYDLILVNDKEFEKYLDKCWKNMEKGLIIVDYIHLKMKAFQDFCKVVNRKPLIFDTRYGVGIVER